MEMQTASDQSAFIGHATQAGGVDCGEDSAREGQTLWEERERRRIQFRLSLTQARSYLSRTAKIPSGYVPTEPQ